MSEQTQAILAHFGPLSAGMAGHILLMNLLAPAIAVLTVRSSPSLVRHFRRLAPPVIVQLLLLWGFHAPPSLAAAMERPGLHLATAGGQWRAIAALLVTSKLFCLLGVLLTFAAHPLYPAMTHHGLQALDPLGDQQLAGLLMLVACPLSYLVAAVIVASNWLLSADQAVRRHEGVKIA
jgi:putative membrane protein